MDSKDCSELSLVMVLDLQVDTVIQGIVESGVVYSEHLLPEINIVKMKLMPL